MSNMPGCHHQERHPKLQFRPNTDHSIHAGLVALQAVARRFARSALGSRRCLVAAEGWLDTESDNQWTGPLERAAWALPVLAWKENGDAHHALLRHQPEGRNAPQLFAVSR
ncbi:MAG: hypothetical protein RMK20_04265, partial [Verrucomicrobiales bacterium]|nr:hypothetical protein [Verrucomicrobiales bacterium]